MSKQKNEPAPLTNEEATANTGRQAAPGSRDSVTTNGATQSADLVTTSEEPKTRQRKLRALSVEVESMADCEEILDRLNADQRRRVLAWLVGIYGPRVEPSDPLDLNDPRR